MRELLGKTGAEHQASVMYQTFGHLDAKPGEKHKGHFVFINGQHGDLCVVHSEFSSFDEGLAISVTVPISSGNWLKTEDPALRSASTGLTANTRFLNAGTGKGFREA